MKKEWKKVDEIYGYKTIKVPHNVHTMIKQGAEKLNMTIIDFLRMVSEKENIKG